LRTTFGNFEFYITVGTIGPKPHGYAETKTCRSKLELIVFGFRVHLMAYDLLFHSTLWR
jgi:hypothetical protein